MASRTESRILRNTYNFYLGKIIYISADQQMLIQPSMNEAKMALEQLDTKACVRSLTNVFEIMDEHSLINGGVIYPGPIAFHQLAHFLS